MQSFDMQSRDERHVSYSAPEGPVEQSVEDSRTIPTKLNSVASLWQMRFRNRIEEDPPTPIPAPQSSELTG